MSKPTVGRIVLYRPGPGEHPKAAEDGQPFAAIVVRIIGDRKVNLHVFDGSGIGYARQAVQLLQEGDAVPLTAYCEWMPYQKGQAQKTEALERAAKDEGRPVPPHGSGP